MSNQDNVVRLLKSFYKITGVKVVIMDIDFNEIMAYPNDHCDYYKMTEKYMPEGIAKYIKSVRLEEAKKLLINTDMSGKKIADKVGYNDYNYFGKDFKKTFGISTKKIITKI